MSSRKTNTESGAGAASAAGEGSSTGPDGGAGSEPDGWRTEVERDDATVMVHGGDRADRVCEALARQGALHLQLASRAIEGRSLDESDPRYPVHYVAFELGEDDWRALARGPGPHSLVLCDGEAASVAAPVPPAVRRALVDDRY